MESVKVYDAYGKLLKEMCVNDHAATLDLGGYAKGVYFVKAISDGNVVAVRKVVKE